MTTASPAPLEQKTVDFYGDQIVAVLLPGEGHDDPHIYVPVKPLCDFLGLDWRSQRQRIQRDRVLAEAVKGVVITTPPSETGRGGGPQEMLCLPAEFIHGWLFGISDTRVRPELADKIVRYRKECFALLWRAFQAQTLTTLGVQKQPSALSSVRDLALAIAQIAEEQMFLESRVTTSEQRLDRAAEVVGDIGRRLAVVEKRVSPGETISDAQATEISQAVKALATLLTPQDRTRNQYQAVFGELYRQFGVSSYKNITTRQFPAVLTFLEEWRKTASSSS